MSYPLGSFIMDHDSDGVIHFYVSIEDVPIDYPKPHVDIADTTTGNKWVEAFNTNSRQLSNSLVALTENLSALFALSQYDSEIKRIANNIDDLNDTVIPLTVKAARISTAIDSDFSVLSARDSDLLTMIGIETAEREATRVEILDYIDETLGKKSNFDSDITTLLDSEISDRIAKYQLLKENIGDFDSDLTIKTDIDSDILAAVQKGDYYIDPDQYDIIYNSVADEIKLSYDSDIEHIIAENFKRYNLIDSEYVSGVEDGFRAYIDAKQAEFQTTDVVDTLVTISGTLKFAKGEAEDTGTAVGLVGFGQAGTEDFVTIEYTAVHTPDAGNKLVQTGKLAFNLPYAIPDNYTFTSEQLMKQTLNITGVDLITNFVLKTENDIYTLYGDINYTSTDGTVVSARMVKV